MVWFRSYWPKSCEGMCSLQPCMHMMCCKCRRIQIHKIQEKGFVQGSGLGSRHEAPSSRAIQIYRCLDFAYRCLCFWPWTGSLHLKRFMVNIAILHLNSGSIDLLIKVWMCLLLWLRVQVLIAPICARGDDSDTFKTFSEPSRK